MCGPMGYGCHMHHWRMPSHMGIPYHHPGAMHHWQMPAVPLTKEQETQILDEQVKVLKQNLEAIEKRLAELKE